MPKRKTLEIDKLPYQYKTKALRMKKSYTKSNFDSHTILTDDPFSYVEFYFNTKPKAVKFRDKAENKKKYGDEKKYHYSFYWKQAKHFYEATKALPIESMPLTAYYCMLNAVKAFLAYRCEYIEDFAQHFSGHGLREGQGTDEGDELSGITVYRLEKGVFVLFGKRIESDFEDVWGKGKSNVISLRKLLYNLAYIHRAYVTTYSSARGAKVPELFLPIVAGKAPYYCKGNDSNLYLTVELERAFFPASAVTIPKKWLADINDEFKVSEDNSFILHSATGAKRNANSLSTEFKDLNHHLRRRFQYIRSSKRLWYLKIGNSSNPDIVDLNSMLITMAVMHRLSEIVRYKPEQLAHLMEGKESWLLHEFLTLALDQFIDELAAEITGEEIMCTGMKG